MEEHTIQMRRIESVLASIVAALSVLFFMSGCEQPTQAPPSSIPTAPTTPKGETRPVEPSQAVLPAGYGPIEVRILPLTELTAPAAGQQGTRLTIYISLTDAFGSQIKAPAVLRFELYEYIPRSAQSKGQRLAIWPDVDITTPTENQQYWRDYLRAYEFDETTDVARTGTYVLEVTCTLPGGKRLFSEFIIKPES